MDESKQMDFAKVEKRVRTTGGGSTGTVRYAIFDVFCFHFLYISSHFCNMCILVSYISFLGCEP